MCQVSVVVLTYNPDGEKLRQTLRGVLAQTGVALELILCDDGSARKDFSFLPEFLGDRLPWKLIENPENRGTVYNCYSGIEAARGEYVFLTSPGDILFDSDTLHRFYTFAKAQNAPLCFGNAVRYGVSEGKPYRTAPYSIPPCPEVYKGSLRQQKISFFGDNLIIGACYFRSRELALRLLQPFLGLCKYMEDTPTTMLALLEGIPLAYLDSNIIFYEDGTGVSTGGNTKWKKLLHADLSAALRLLREKFPKDACLQIACGNALCENRIRRIASRFLRHPIYSLAMLREKKLRRPKTVPCSRADMERLQKLLEL